MQPLIIGIFSSRQVAQITDRILTYEIIYTAPPRTKLLWSVDVGYPGRRNTPDRFTCKVFINIENNFEINALAEVISPGARLGVI